MHQMLQEYKPKIQGFSLDESFLDFSNKEHLYPFDYVKDSRLNKIIDEIRLKYGNESVVQ